MQDYHSNVFGPAELNYGVVYKEPDAKHSGGPYDDRGGIAANATAPQSAGEANKALDAGGLSSVWSLRTSPIPYVVGALVLAHFGNWRLGRGTT